MERMQSKEKTSEKITCSLVVLPLDTNTMWKPVSPDTGNTSNPIIIMSINLCQQSRIQQVSISLSWLVLLSFQYSNSDKSYKLVVKSRIYIYQYFILLKLFNFMDFLNICNRWWKTRLKSDTISGPLAHCNNSQTTELLRPHILIDINHLLIRWHHIWSTGKKKDTLQYFQQFLDLLCALGHTPSKRRKHWSYGCTMNTRKGRKICSSSGLYSYSPMGSDGQMSEK